MRRETPRAWTKGCASWAGAVSQASTGGRVWFDGERQASATSPFDVALFRSVPGQPARGAVPDDTWGDWQGPVFRRLWGTAGEDGEGIEWIHCLNDDTSIPSSELPSDTLAYDAARNASGRDVGFVVGGRRWFDEQPEEGSASKPWLASMSRRVPGVPVRGTVPSGDAWGPWRGPVFQRIWTSDGATTEAAYAVTATSNKPTALADGLNYQASRAAPSTPTADTPYRTRPDLSSSLPFGWVNERRVDGQPNRDDDVGDVAWNGWALAEHYGDGEDGEGIEWIHCLNDDTSIPSSELPSDTLAYDAARNASGRDVGFVVGGRRWFDEQPEAGSASKPWLASMFRRVPGVPARGTVPSGDAWGPWRGPKFQRIFVAPPTTVNRPVLDAVLEWDDAAGNWRNGDIVNQLVEWHQGTTRIEEIRVKLAGRPGTDGDGECRMNLSGIDSSPGARVDGVLQTRSTFNSGWTDLPCTHTIEVEGVICAVSVRRGTRQQPTPITAEPNVVALFVRQTGVTYTADVTWRRGSETARTSYRTVRFSVSTRNYNTAPDVTAITRSGTLGNVTKGSREGGGSVWTTPFTVEGVVVRVTVVYISLS